MLPNNVTLNIFHLCHIYMYCLLIVLLLTDCLKDVPQSAHFPNMTNILSFGDLQSSQ